jgi:hypothetical protein
MFFIVIPLKNSKLKTFYPWRIPKFQAQNPLPLKNSKLKTFHPGRIPKFQAQNPLHLKNSKLKTFYPWIIPSSKPFTPEELQAQNPLPLNNSKLKTLYTWRIPNSKHFTPEEFQAQNTLPLKNSKLKTLYPWRIPGILDKGGTDIKWNSPIRARLQQNESAKCGRCLKYCEKQPQVSKTPIRSTYNSLAIGRIIIRLGWIVD